MTAGPQVHICDVGPRDGLQNEPTVLAPETRAQLCRQLACAGLPGIEVASFVREDRVPAMAGAERVVAAVSDLEGVTISALVLNDHGYDRALACGPCEIHYAFPVTDTFGRRNQGVTVAEGVATAARLAERARIDGVRLEVTLSAAFGCPFEGRVETERVIEVARAVHAAGPASIVLADSIGIGLPWQVRELVASVTALGAEVGCHFHNTRNTGYANALAAVEAGVRRLDASIGGLGGCPFAPGATGNIATEDLVYLLAGMGYRTGIAIDALRETSAWLASEVGHALDSMVARAGDPCGLALADASV